MYGYYFDMVGLGKEIGGVPEGVSLLSVVFCCILLYLKTRPLSCLFYCMSNCENVMFLILQHSLASQVNGLKGRHV